MGEKRLFEDLPDQAAPERARGKPRIMEPQRQSVELRAVDLESLVAADDPVRDVWAYVETLDLTELYARIEAREGEPGHPAITPKLLIALWLYATLRGVGSARELARLCAREIGFQWLCGCARHHGVSTDSTRFASPVSTTAGDAIQRALSRHVG
jgi:transposase